MHTKSSSPAVTIGLPVHNGGATLRRALDDLLGQTFDEFELVVSENASTDDTPSILASVDDPRLRVVTQSEVLPIAANFGAVLDEATGRYFMWAAADDQWEPDFVATLFDLLESDPTAGGAMSSLALVDSAGRTLGEVLYRGEDSPEWLGWKRMLRRVLWRSPGPSLHYFIYGLYRTEVLRSVMRQPIDAVAAGDRALVTEIVLATRLRATPRLLHQRTRAEVALPERYPGDPMTTSAGSTWWRAHFVRAVWRRLWHSQAVRPSYKFAAIPVLLEFTIVELLKLARDGLRA